MEPRRKALEFEPKGQRWESPLQTAADRYSTTYSSLLRHNNYDVRYRGRINTDYGVRKSLRHAVNDVRPVAPAVRKAANVACTSLPRPPVASGSARGRSQTSRMADPGILDNSLALIVLAKAKLGCDNVCRLRNGAWGAWVLEYSVERSGHRQDKQQIWGTGASLTSIAGAKRKCRDRYGEWWTNTMTPERAPYAPRGREEEERRMQTHL